MEAAARLEQYGPNADAAPKHASVAGAVLRRLLEPLSLILLAAGIVSAATGDGIGGAIIVTILALSIGLDTFQEGRAVKAAEVLRRSVALKAEVKRDGAFVAVEVDAVVPGRRPAGAGRRHHSGRRAGARGDGLHRQRSGADRRALSGREAPRRP